MDTGVTFKLKAKLKNGAGVLEQDFTDYQALRTKEKELIESGWETTMEYTNTAELNKIVQGMSTTEDVKMQ